MHEEGEAGDINPVGRAVAQAFFGKDDAAFPVDGGRGDGEFARCFPEEHQGGVDGVVVGMRQVELVEGLLEVGGGVGVCAESQATALQGLDHLAFRNLLRAVESHVLKEVGETGLSVRLHQGAGVDAKAERGLARRRLLAADRVAHAVRQGAEDDVRVRSDVAVGLGPFPGLEFGARLELGGLCGVAGAGGEQFGRGGEARQRDMGGGASA